MAFDDFYFVSPYQIIRPEYMRFLINGKEVKVLVNSLTIDDVIGERTPASFSAMTDTFTFFEQGQPVEIYDESMSLIFAGVIDKPTVNKPPGTNILIHNMQCKDWHYLADKRIIANAYENTLAGDIVRDIINNKLASEGITVGLVQDGVIVTEAVFNYIKITQALDALAEKTGFIWYIDFDKKLYFIERSTYVAPWIITGRDVFPDVTVEHGNSKYRNYQYIKGATDLTDPQTQEFRGDGKQTVFNTGFKVAKVPTVKVNGIVQTVGIRGLDTDKQWYWSKGETAISQDNSGTPILSTDTISVTYQGEFPIVVITKNDAEIISRQTIEQNSGLNEEVEDEPQTSNRESAFQSANAKLKKYSVIGRRVKFRTNKKGLEAGSIATINIVEHGLNNAEMLIESVTISDDSGKLFYEVSAVEGPEEGSWTKMFEKMATRGQAFVIRENINEDEVFIVLASFTKTWNESDSPVNIFKEVYASDVLFPSDALFPMFEPTDRVKHLVLLNSMGQEIFSKVVSRQTGATTGVINSTTYIAPFEANSNDINKIAWYGGMWSNVKIDEQPYIKSKTELEAIQVERIDNRNFTQASGTKKLNTSYFQNIDDQITALINKSL